MASLVAAAAGYVVVLIAAWTLDPAANADFLAFWALLFALFGVLGGVQHETTRAVGTAVGRADVPHGTPVLPLGLAVGAGVGVVVLATGPWWAGPVLGGTSWVLVVALALGALAFSGHAAIAGALSGQRRWSLFAGLVGAEAVVRLALVGLATLAGASVGGLEVAAAAAAGTWVLLALALPGARGAARARADVDGRAFLRRVAQAMTAAAASAVLVVGFPVLLRLTSAPEVYSASAPLLLAISLTRAPLMIPLGAYQGVAITHVLAHRDRGLAALRPVLLVVVAAGTIGAGLAYLVGPWLTETLVRPDYRVEGPVLAGLTFAAALLALVTLTGAAALALDRHRTYLAGWLAATATSIALLLVPLPVEGRAVLALAVGPVVGAAVHAAGLLRRSGRGR